MSEAVTREYTFRYEVPSGYRDARRLAPEPWKRESTEILSNRVAVDRERTIFVFGRVRYTVKGNSKSDIERKIQGAAKKLGLEIKWLEVERVA